MRAKQIVRSGVGAAALILWAAGASGAVRVGDAYDSVIARLGEPRGYIDMGSQSWLHYDRGTVKLENGRVVEAKLVSAEQAATRIAREREEWERRRVLQEEQRARRIREGYAVKESRVRDPQFGSSSAAGQAAFWRDFQARYPEVPAHAEYAAAMERYRWEQEQGRREQERDRRIRDLEEQLRQAEARERSRTAHYYGAPRVVYVPYPPTVVHPIRTVTLIHGQPVGSTRTRPIAMSHADRVFGSMSTTRAPGYYQTHRPSGLSGTVRFGF